jgi:hypothetical protein
MDSKEQSLIWCIAYRYQKLVREHGLLTTRTDEELMQRLCEAHRIQPLDLSSMTAAEDLDLVIAVGDIDLHYCKEARRIKDNFISKFAAKEGMGPVGR